MREEARKIIWRTNLENGGIDRFEGKKTKILIFAQIIVTAENWLNW